MFPSFYFVYLSTLARPHFFPHEKPLEAGFQVSKQIGTPGGTWFSSHLRCNVVVGFIFASPPTNTT